MAETTLTDREADAILAEHQQQERERLQIENKDLLKINLMLADRNEQLLKEIDDGR